MDRLGPGTSNDAERRRLTIKTSLSKKLEAHTNQPSSSTAPSQDSEIHGLTSLFDCTNTSKSTENKPSVPKEQHYFMIKGQYKPGEEATLTVMSIKTQGIRHTMLPDAKKGGTATVPLLTDQQTQGWTQADVGWMTLLCNPKGHCLRSVEDLHDALGRSAMDNDGYFLPPPATALTTSRTLRAQDSTLRAHYTLHSWHRQALRDGYAIAPACDWCGEPTQSQCGGKCGWETTVTDAVPSPLCRVCEDSGAILCRPCSGAEPNTHPASLYPALLQATNEWWAPE
jgi:hypothetical protein